MPEFDFPDWLEEFIVDEQEFVRSYNHISPLYRTLIKKDIAQIINWYGLDRIKEVAQEYFFQQEFSFVRVIKPKTWALIFLDPRLTSPSLLLAAVLPAKLAGVKNIGLIRLKDESSSEDDWPQRQLLALELAGVENVYSLPQKEAERLIRELSEKNIDLSLINLGWTEVSFPLSLFRNKHISLYWPWIPQKGGVWFKNDLNFDWQALEFFFPELELRFWNQEKDNQPAKEIKGEADWDQFLKQDFDILFLDKTDIDQLATQVPIILGPGEEFFWLWPELELNFFCSTRLSVY